MKLAHALDILASRDHYEKTYDLKHLSFEPGATPDEVIVTFIMYIGDMSYSSRFATREELYSFFNGWRCALAHAEIAKADVVDSQAS